MEVEDKGIIIIIIIKNVINIVALSQNYMMQATLQCQVNYENSELKQKWNRMVHSNWTSINGNRLILVTQSDLSDNLVSAHLGCPEKGHKTSLY